MALDLLNRSNLEQLALKGLIVSRSGISHRLDEAAVAVRQSSSSFIEASSGVSTSL